MKTAREGDPVLAANTQQQLAVYEIIIAALVRRQGGTVTLTQAELMHPPARSIQWRTKHVPVMTMDVHVQEEAPPRSN